MARVRTSCPSSISRVSWMRASTWARTRTGRGFFAVRENEKTAATLGVELTRYKLLAFVVSGGIAALAGAVYVTYQGIAEAQYEAVYSGMPAFGLGKVGKLMPASGARQTARGRFGVPV